MGLRAVKSRVGIADQQSSRIGRMLYPRVNSKELVHYLYQDQERRDNQAWKSHCQANNQIT